MSGTITKVSGPLVVAENLADANVSDVSASVLSA